MSEAGPESKVDQQEIESKFLVETLPELDIYPSKKIIQGYVMIDDNGSEVRIRDKEGERTLTVKSGGDAVRSEHNEPIRDNLFDALWPLTAGKRVVKTRYEIAYGDYTIELDVFDGDLKGLVTVEVEFPDTESQQAFVPPDWFGLDVTADPSFKNQSLAVHGLPLAALPSLHQIDTAS